MTEPTDEQIDDLTRIFLYWFYKWPNPTESTIRLAIENVAVARDAQLRGEVPGRPPEWSPDAQA